MTKSPRGPSSMPEDLSAPVVPTGPVVPVTRASDRSDFAMDHPHQNLDRAARAARARMSAGISAHSFIEAWTDWAQHMSQAPGRQLELIVSGASAR